MKHKIIAVVLTLLLIPVCVYADGVIIECEESTMNIKMNLIDEKYANLIVSKKGEEIHNNDNIFAMKRSISDNDGVVSFSFTMPDEKGSIINGEYDVVIKPDGEDVIKDSFIYATNEDRKGLEEEILSATEYAQIGDALGKSENRIVLKAMGINVEDYILIENKDKILKNIFENKKTLTDNSYLSDCINTEISLDFINNSKDIKKHLSVINPVFEETAFGELSDAEAEFLIECINAGRVYENAEKMIEKYKEAAVLYKINNTRFDRLEETLSKYANSLGIENTNEYISYKGLSSKISANEKFADSVKITPLKSISELLGVLRVSVINNNAVLGGSSGGSYGGSSGSSSGSNKAPALNPVTVTKPVVVNNIVFQDISETQWAVDAINSMAKNGVVSGDGSGNFYPNREMTREEFVKMLVVAAKLYDEKAECSFEDVEPGKWYYSYIASAVNSGMIYGVSETEFGVGSKLTRQDMAVICHRIKAKDLETIREEKIFNDYQSISDYAKDAVSALYTAGIINGIDEDNFSPFDTATRAQGAVIIHNLFF